MLQKNILVIGTGKSGLGCADLLCRLGASVVLFDEDRNKNIDDIKNLIMQDSGNVRILLGELTDEEIKQFDLAVPSPGIALDTGLMLRIKESGIKIISEIELAYLNMKGKLVAITGTNGKTTTTSLTGELLKQVYNKVLVVGNIGEAFTAHALETSNDSVTVAEVSSFQLETIDRFHPDVSAVLNITPDHLNRHYTMENYAGIKKRILKNVGKGDVCVFNFNDKYTYEFGMESGLPKILWFSSSKRPPCGFWLSRDKIIEIDGKEEREILTFSDCLLKGRVGAENIMAALCICKGLGIDAATLAAAVKSFKPVPHRIEFIANKRGVDYYNDSKATNPDSAICGIEAMTKPTILIGGGYDKNNSYDEWIESFKGRVKELVLIGQTADNIAKCAEKHGFTSFCKKDGFKEALEYCTSKAKDGDAVLLSPACASWGMFPNYEVRGDEFRDYVNSLK